MGLQRLTVFIFLTLVAGTLRADRPPADAQAVVEGVLARYDAVKSMQLAYELECGFRSKDSKPDKVVTTGKYLLSLQGKDWSLKAEGGGVQIEKGGRQVGFWHTLQPDGLVTHAVAVTVAEGIDKNGPSPPYFAGTIWDRLTVDYIRKHKVPDAMRPANKSIYIEGKRGCILEWTISKDDVNAFRAIPPSLENGGILRLYVSLDQGSAVSRVEFALPAGKIPVFFQSTGFKEYKPGIYLPARCTYQTDTSYYVHYEIESVTSLNEPISEELFSVRLPEGTVVADSRSGSGSIVFEVTDTSSATNPVPDLNDLLKYGK